MHIFSGYRIDHTFYAHYVYDVALFEFNNSIHESLSTAMHPHKWWFFYSFQIKQSDQKLNLPPNCFPKPTFTFKSVEIKYYLKDLNSHGGLHPDSTFPLFLNKLAVI